MQFELMIIDDYDEMIELWRNTPGVGLTRADARDGIERFLVRNSGLCFVATELGRIIGTILCGFDGRRGYIYHLAVDQAYRSRGIGKMLVHKSLEALKSAGAYDCRLFVLKSNDLGQEFYKGTGWQQKEHIVLFGKDL